MANNFFQWSIQPVLVVFRSNYFIFDTNFRLTWLNSVLLLKFLLYFHLLLLLGIVSAGIEFFFFFSVMLPAHLSDISLRKRDVQWKVFPEHELDWSSIFWMQRSSSDEVLLLPTTFSELIFRYMQQTAETYLTNIFDEVSMITLFV